MTLPPDTIERTYAGVLGKIIGVYLGRPFEGWSYERITQELGEINGYVHEKLGLPLVVTDDDISGTFTFLRALPDHGNSLDLTPFQVGQTWLNYLIEEKTILWWGGMGNSTEHTAYLRLKHGIPAPQSGSIALNGPIVAEQIGSQIFIDGWAMVAPGNPALAVDLARRAASVSHDREAIYGAQVLAAMEAQAYVESDINRLLDTAVSFIPSDSIIYRLIADLRRWHKIDGDWRRTRQRIVEQYGYNDYIGNCHMVPNHALIILGLLYGEGDFQKSLMICNTSGWDTDCNSGNLGCLLGIRNGLSAFEGAYDWRSPVADRIYLPTMDGGRCITDAVNETYHIVNIARGLQGEAPLAAKDAGFGASRFNFELPGSVQGFRAECGSVTLENSPSHSRFGQRTLAARWNDLAENCPVRVTTPTFILPEDLNMRGYQLIASPTLYPGQTLRAGLCADEINPGAVTTRLVIRYYDENNQPALLAGAEFALAPGAYHQVDWTVPDLPGMPIFAVGFEALLDVGAAGALYLDYLTWNGAANTTFAPPQNGKRTALWRQAWVNAVDQWDRWWTEPFRLIKNEGRGMISTGTREWRDYRLTAPIRPALVKSGGLAVRVQGLRRFYALEFSGAKTLRLLKVVDDQETVMAEIPFDWQLWRTYPLSLEIKGDHLRAWVEGQLVFEVDDPGSPLNEGAIGLVVEEGNLMADWVQVEAV
ncbi:MAG TPA: ADP-ribosylglycohydrolase family protein [Levilinea sp.]|nr:ADP-ribosylglycohydrolase family protein [Levilinea sp.]